jgi:hypothetical protein
MKLKKKINSEPAASLGAPPPKRKRLSLPRKINLPKAVALRSRGMSYNDIAPLVGLAPGNGAGVRKSIDSFLSNIPDKETLERFETLKIPALQATMGKMIEGLNDFDKLSKASLNNVAYSLTQVNQALRLEQDKSTANIAYADALSALKQAKLELNKLNDISPERTAPECPEPFIIPVIVNPQLYHDDAG